LSGDARSRRIVVTVPLRLAAAMSVSLPPADALSLKAAARMKAERAFVALGPVAIDAVLSPMRDGHVDAFLLALPRVMLESICVAATAQGRTVIAVRVAELVQPIPIGGVVSLGRDSAIIASDGSGIRGVQALGAVDAPGYVEALARARLLLGVDEDAPAAPALGSGIDFLHPSLTAPVPLLARPAIRYGVLVGGIAALLIVAFALTVRDSLNGLAAATAEAEQLQPLAKVLSERRSDLKECAAWFDERVSMAPALHVLSQALPDAKSSDQVRLVRVRQLPGEDLVAEGAAGDRAQMMAFLERVRADARIASAEVRNSRSPSKESRAVVFELVFKLTPAGSTLPVAAATAEGKPDASS
jgi:hypothetical protein